MVSEENTDSGRDQEVSPVDAEQTPPAPEDRDQPSLDPAILRALLEAEDDQASPLLDTASLGGSEGLLDDRPIIDTDPESLIVPAANDRLAPAEPSARELEARPGEDLYGDDIPVQPGAAAPTNPTAAIDGSELAGKNLLKPDDLDLLANILGSEEAITEKPSEEPLAEEKPLASEELTKLLAESSAGSEASASVATEPGEPAPLPIPDVAPMADTDSGGFLNREAIDRLLGSLPSPPEPAIPAPSAEGLSSAPGELARALDAVRSSSEVTEMVVENLAAANSRQMPEAGPLAQADLDALMAQARQQEPERSAVKSSGPARVVAPPPQDINAGAGYEGTAAIPAVRPPSPVMVSLRHHLPRIGASLAAGLLTALSVFTALYVHQVEVPGFLSQSDGARDLAMPLKRARAFMAGGEMLRAAAELEQPIARSQPSPERAEAQYLQIEALYQGFALDPYSGLGPGLHAKIDAAIMDAPTHSRAPEALHWKAKLYELDELPYAAQEVYERIMRSYPNAKDMDGILTDGARLALKLGDPKLAAEWAQRLLQQFPGSARVGEARMLLGDAYAEAGLTEDARTLYVRVTEAGPDTDAGAEAFLRLARLAYAQGRYADVAQQLETRMASARTLKGNDEAYLLLAQAYRRLRRFDEARNTLNDLLNFFPETAVTPDALVELSQVLEELGQRDAALQTAQHAAARFPGNPQVLRNKGEFLGLTGNPFAAAVALVAADEAGAHDPGLLLKAARYYKTAGVSNEADRTYGLLRKGYGGSPQALTGGVEQAELLHEMGRYTEAVNQLEELAKITEKNPQHLAVLLAMSEVYRGLGLDQRVTEISREIAETASEPEDLARAALDLLGAKALDEAQRLADRVDLARVSNATAYALLARLGEALLEAAPRRGLDKMEEAYLSYPEERTLDDGQRLLDAYLSADRSEAARRLVMDLAAATAERPVDTPYLIDAAISWGDYLYARSDYRAAAEAYAMALESAAKTSPGAAGHKSDIRWAKYQRANALLALADYRGSLNLFQEVAGSDAPWAREASIKAEYARLEQQMRGESNATTEG